MFDYAPTKLVVSALALTDPREIELATIIAEETEAERERERERDQAPRLASLQELNKVAGLLSGVEFSYADSLRWDELLTLGTCALRCAARANLPVQDLVKFADARCRAGGWLLFWFREYLFAIAQRLTVEEAMAERAKQLEEAQDVQRRIKEGARLGGQKSGQQRRAIQSTPSGKALLDERQKLIRGGMEARNVAAFQANKYKVSAAAIRAGYKRK